MYNILRQIHLYAGLILLMFVAMYFATGVVMTHGRYFPKRATTDIKSEQAVTYSGPRTAEAVSAWAQENLHTAGRGTQSVQKPDGSWDLRYANAGSETRVQIPPSFDKETTVVKTRNAIDAVNGLHRIHGYNGGWFYVSWAVMYDLASTSMIVFGITGVVLWYSLTRKRAFGWALLAISFAYPAAMIIYLLVAR